MSEVFILDRNHKKNPLRMGHQFYFLRLISAFTPFDTALGQTKTDNTYLSNEDIICYLTVIKTFVLRVLYISTILWHF